MRFLDILAYNCISSNNHIIRYRNIFKNFYSWSNINLIPATNACTHINITLNHAKLSKLCCAIHNNRAIMK